MEKENNTMRHILIGERRIGPDHPAFLVAEIGINHNGDMELARAMIDAAAESGADSVKFQNYRTEDFISDRSLTYEYVSQGKPVVETCYDMFKCCELSRDDLMMLSEHCSRRGVVFHSTPTSPDGIADLLAASASVFKNGSDYLTHLPLIRAMGETGLPTVISTGMATLCEIDEAVRIFRATGNDRLILLHCTSCYPTLDQEVNLRRIPALAMAFGCLVGFSDHTCGILGAAGAVLLGACWIEKHFTLDKNLPGPDQSYSSDPAEFKSLVESVRSIEKMKGTSGIQPTVSETRSRREFRLSCVAANELSAGHDLTEADIAFRRPGIGLPPGQAHLLLGRRLKHSLSCGEVITLNDLE
jgi:N,N'-diacetyllegionaminate synthase